MDTQQLKFLAERLRTFLKHQGQSLKHGHALDLIAALPGLRNWPEVTAFPDRLRETELTMPAVDRLVRRLAGLRAITVDSGQLFAALSGAEITPVQVPRFWPAGPSAGIYVTTVSASAERAIARYAREAPDALMYCERVGADAENAIDLGEYGVFSKGLEKAPAGTLVVLGPIEFVQESWEENRDRMEKAAYLAQEAGHRVIVVVETPMPSTLHYDASLLIQWEDSEPGYVDPALRGVITEEGDFAEVSPFVKERPVPLETRPVRPAMEFPSQLAGALQTALHHRRYGMVVVADNQFESRFSLLEAALPSLDYAGPPVRIQPHFRIGYGGEPPLSDRFSGIPICPSIEVAYAHGYRRMIIEGTPDDQTVKSILKYSDTACFLVASFGGVEAAFAGSLMIRADKQKDCLEGTIAVLCRETIKSAKGPASLYDAYIAGADIPDKEYDDLIDFVSNHRVVRWEDGLRDLISRDAVTYDEVTHGLRGHDLKKFFRESLDSDTTDLTAAH